VIRADRSIARLPKVEDEAEATVMKRLRIGAPQRVGSASVIRERGSAYCPLESGLVHRVGHPGPTRSDGDVLGVAVSGEHRSAPDRRISDYP
jgi:hypothetical protein